jgi:iron complex transport system substrate-binding protein
VIPRGVLLLALVALSGSACDKEPPVHTSVTATRVVTLAPSLAELAFEIGAGDRIVGVSAWSDYPEAVLDLPIVGDAFAIDHEQLALLHPDLILAWESGMPAHVVDELRQSGYRVEVIRTRSLADVGQAVVQLGALLERQDAASDVVARFRGDIDRLTQKYEDAEPIRVFYQIASRPLYTINNEHYLGDIVSLCGGVNIFHDLGELAPTIADEAVIARDPEVMLAGDKSAAEPFKEWLRWPGIAANRYGNQFLISSDSSSRPTPRLVIAATEICSALEKGRENRRSTLAR